MNKKITDPHALNVPDFRWFLIHIPDTVLKKVNLQRSSVWGVGAALAQFGSYERGTGFRVSHLALSEVSGASRNTVKKVMEFLKEIQAIEVTDYQRRGGTPSENYRLRKSPFVARVLELADKNYKSQDEQSEPRVLSIEHSLSPSEHSVLNSEHNKNHQNDKNRSDESSPAPSSLGLTARDGALDVDELFRDMYDREQLGSLLEGI